MALTVTIVKRNVVGAQREVIADVTFDSSYPTGGESFTVADVDPGESSSSAFHVVLAEQNNATATVNRLATYDYANKKLLLLTALSTEAANASDQSTIILRVLARYGQVTG